MASDVKKFIEAKTRAEGDRQVAMSAAKSVFRAAENERSPTAQVDYDAAVAAADRAYYESVIASAEKFGIDPGSHRVALANLPRTRAA